MTEVIKISKVNEAHARIDCEVSTLYELSDRYTFLVPNAKFHPLVRNKVWDGKIRLLNVNTRMIYAGLVDSIVEYATSAGYEVEFVDNAYTKVEFSLNEAVEFCNTLDLPVSVRDYQTAALAHGVRSKRSLLLSPTASGKSLIIYLLTRYYSSKTLIVVPTVSLVHQMASDFVSYGYDKNRIHCITAGADKMEQADVIISTWQSIYKIHKNWFKQFNVVIGDEAHLFKAKSLCSIMEKLYTCEHRFGFTGTLDGTETNKMVLEGLFGSVKRVASTTDLIEQKHLAELRIKVLLLKYSDEVRKAAKGYDYPTEMDFIVRHAGRNKLIKNLTLSLKGNILLLFQYVEKHGKELYEIITKADPTRKVFFIHGGVDGEKREDIRSLVENETNAIIVASSGTFSTGVNIKNLHNIIFTSPSKSKIKTLQSIGRGLRKSDTKDSVVLFDIADDLSWKTHKNYTLEHFKERLKIYSEEGFDYKLYNIEVKE
jgi:superfamily II DNA or RNA helicase